MGELLAKLSTYNLFNYLFPGAVFVFVIRHFGIWNLSSENIVIDLFLFYFSGMTISRIGSVVIEPLFKLLRIVEYADYSDYIEASKQDPKINELLEVNNVYRTIVALLLCLAITYVAAELVANAIVSEELTGILISSLVFILYVFSFRKQRA